MKKFNVTYEQIASYSNIYATYLDARKGKSERNEIMRFSLELDAHLNDLYNDLQEERYKVSGYRIIYIYVPKKRLIMALQFRDRVLQWAVYRLLNPLYEKKYHNYFGMKCGSAWKGKSVNMSTCEEYEVGVLTQIKDNFRVYDSLEEGVKGYFDFISASRYANLKGVTDPKTYIENIKADGYATSSQYVKNLLNLVSAYNLTQYDNITAQQGKKSVAEIAQEVIAGAWGNGTERKEKLEAAGYNYAEVQAIVNERAGNKTENKVDNKKSIAEIAQEVVAGKWGNGSERKQRLEAEGYDYAEVQATVNNIMGKSQPNKKNVAEIANEVISGKWGNGSERKEKLEAAGYNYAEVQAKVNEMLR